MPVKTYNEYKDGVLNAIEGSEIPFDAFMFTDKFHFVENFWRKIPGLVEINDTAIGVDPVWSAYVFHQVIEDKKFIITATGGSVYKYDVQTRSFSIIHQGMNPNQQVEFLEYQNRLYFGSQYDNWRMFDGGEKTYPVGGSQAPKKFKKIIFNEFAGRFFGIGSLDNPDYLYWSNHIDDGGIEVWPDANIQIISPVSGDSPKTIETFEGRITIFSDHSINSGSVVGVPENWSFQREKAKAGPVGIRALKRYGQNFYCFTKEKELYVWPRDEFISKGRVKFNPDPNFMHLMCMEIVSDRFLYMLFKSAEAVSSNKYHLWIYDILGDRFSGPHTQFNAVSMFTDENAGITYFGGADDLAGFLLEHRGKNIKNKSMRCHIRGAFSDYGVPYIDKRFKNVWVKCKQAGSLKNGEGQVEFIVNVDNRYNNRQSQRFTLEDPANENLTDTNAVKEAVTKRLYVHDAYSLGNAFQFEIIHDVLNGDFAFSQIDVEYDLKGYKKEARAA